MRAKTAIKLCAASAVAGAALAPPAARRAKKTAGMALKKGAEQYVEAREKVKKVTGKPGHMAAVTAKAAGHGAAEMAHRWRGLVRDAERERAAEAPGPGDGATPKPVDIDELMASRN